MVRLTRIYTRTGDDGTTGLGDGSRVRKTSPRIEAYGCVDELNSVLGLCAELAAGPLLERLRRLQQDLFDLGADLCQPPGSGKPVLVGAARVARLEGWIDEANERLAPLTSFILPGGGPLAAHLHLARTVCRRAERRVLALAELEAVDAQGLHFLNRLSDLCFVWSRVAAGGQEVLWVPTRDEGGPG